MTPRPGPLLVLDAGSPRSSVALADAGRLLAATELDRSREKADLLAALAGVLASAGVERGALAGVVTLRGPGSFTGLRIAGSLALGLSRGLGVPAGSVSTFEALALAAPDDDGTLLCAVDAMRGEWHVRPMELRGAGWPRPLAPAATVSAGTLPALPVGGVVGFGVRTAWADGGSTARAIEPSALAPEVAVRLSSGAGPDWWEEPVTHPHYLRAPAVTAPRPR